MRAGDGHVSQLVQLVNSQLHLTYVLYTTDEHL